MRGLLGKTLSHSFSKEIHENIDNKAYSLLEVDNLAAFFQDKTFDEINVTIPYKKAVIPFLDEVSDNALKLQSVNTIVNRNNRLIGYNTDIAGFEYLLEHYKINCKNKIVGILGNGATKRIVEHVLLNKNVEEIIIFARNPKVNEYKLNNNELLSKVDILINCTPNGMYPHNEADVIVDINSMKKCSTVIDLIYNPLRTKLLLAAETANKKAVNGLIMLIHQAVAANAIFNNKYINTEITKKLHRQIFLSKLNIVLIGMPMSGKTFFSRLISKRYAKENIDLDTLITEIYNDSINNIFKKHGEPKFRELETNSIIKLYKHNNKAISSGGGVVVNEKNIGLLKQNGLILFIDMPLNILKKCNPKGRPLLADSKNLEKLFNERYTLYNQYADKRIEKNGFKEPITMKRIEVAINEYISN